MEKPHPPPFYTSSLTSPYPPVRLKCLSGKRVQSLAASVGGRRGYRWSKRRPPVRSPNSSNQTDLYTLASSGQPRRRHLLLPSRQPIVGLASGGILAIKLASAAVFFKGGPQVSLAL